MWKPPETSWTKKELFCLAALLAVLFIWTLAPLQGFDFWYYLAVGRFMAENHTIPWSESFLGTTSVLSFGRYADQTWMSSVFFYGFYLAGGTTGLILSRSVLLCSITAVTYLNCRLIGAAPWTAALWATLGLWTVRSRFLLRSYHFSDLGLAVLVFCLIRYHDRPKARLISLAATFCVWSNFHQGVIAGWVLVFIWAVCGGTTKLEGFKSLVVVFVASLVRPHGYMFPAFIYDHFGNHAAVQGVVEWAPLEASQVVEHLGPFLAVSLILVTLRLRRDRTNLPWYYLIISVAFLVLAVRSQRAVAELFPVAFPLLIPFFPKLTWKWWKAGLATATLASLLLFTNPLTPWRDLNVLYPRYPVRLQEIASKLPGQVFNSYEYGSFLSFHDIPPFIHGTTSLFKEQLVLDFQAILASAEQRDALIEKYDVQTFLVHFPKEEDSTESLLNYLYRKPDWKMVAWDDSGFVFTRGPAEEGLVAVKPWVTKVRWQDPVAARAELEALVQSVPSAMAYTLLSQLSNEQQDWPDVIKQARKAVELVPHASRAWQALAYASYQTGDLATALEATKEAVRWEPDNPEVQFNRAFILFQGHPDLSGFQGWLIKREIRHHLGETLRLSPENRAARQLLDELS